MLNILRQYLLLLRLESLSSAIIFNLFNTEGKIELEELLAQLTTSGSRIERLFILELIIRSVDGISDCSTPVTAKEAKMLIAKLRKPNEENLEEQIGNKANLKLFQLRAYFELGRKALWERPTSLEAMRYQIECEDKKPLSKKDIEALARIATIQSRSHPNDN